MKKETGITIISLVVTIIILIILAGISINLTLGENGLITKAKQVKENIELAQIEEQEYLNELYSKLETEGGTSGDISYDAIAKLAEFKIAIANAIDEAGGIRPENTAETLVFANNIKGILKEVTKNATATSNDIANGKTAWVNGKLVTGALNKEPFKIKELRMDANNGERALYLTFDTTNYSTFHVDNFIRSGNIKTYKFWLGSTHNLGWPTSDIATSNCETGTSLDVDISDYDTIYLFVSIHTIGESLIIEGLSLY